MDTEKEMFFKVYLNNSIGMFEGIIDDYLPIFYKDCTKKAEALAFKYNLKFDESRVYDILNETFRTLENKIINEYCDIIDFYKGRIGFNNVLDDIINNYMEDLEGEFKKNFNNFFLNQFEEFKNEFNFQIKANTDLEMMFKNELTNSIREKMEYVENDIYLEFKNKISLGLEEYLTPNKNEEKEDISNHPLILEISEMSEYLDRASNKFKEVYNMYIELAAKIIHSGLDMSKVDENIKKALNNYRNQMLNEMGFLKQGYTSDDYEENFDGTYTLVTEAKTL